MMDANTPCDVPWWLVGGGIVVAVVATAALTPRTRAGWCALVLFQGVLALAPWLIGYWWDVLDWNVRPMEWAGWPRVHPPYALPWALWFCLAPVLAAVALRAQAAPCLADAWTWGWMIPFVLAFPALCSALTTMGWGFTPLGGALGLGLAVSASCVPVLGGVLAATAVVTGVVSGMRQRRPFAIVAVLPLAAALTCATCLTARYGFTLGMNGFLLSLASLVGCVVVLLAARRDRPGAGDDDRLDAAARALDGRPRRGRAVRWPEREGCLDREHRPFPGDRHDRDWLSHQ